MIRKVAVMFTEAGAGLLFEVNISPFELLSRLPQKVEPGSSSGISLKHCTTKPVGLGETV